MTRLAAVVPITLLTLSAALLTSCHHQQTKGEGEERDQPITGNTSPWATKASAEGEQEADPQPTRARYPWEEEALAAAEEDQASSTDVKTDEAGQEQDQPSVAGEQTKPVKTGDSKPATPAGDTTTARPVASDGPTTTTNPPEREAPAMPEKLDLPTGAAKLSAPRLSAMLAGDESAPDVRSMEGSGSPEGTEQAEDTGEGEASTSNADSDESTPSETNLGGENASETTTPESTGESSDANADANSKEKAPSVETLEDLPEDGEAPADPPVSPESTKPAEAQPDAADQPEASNPAEESAQPDSSDQPEAKPVEVDPSANNEQAQPASKPKPTIWGRTLEGQVTLVIDASTNMASEDLASAVSEIRAALGHATSELQLAMIAMSGGGTTSFSSEPVAMTVAKRRDAQRWLDALVASGGRDFSDGFSAGVNASSSDCTRLFFIASASGEADSLPEDVAEGVTYAQLLAADFAGLQATGTKLEIILYGDASTSPGTQLKALHDLCGGTFDPIPSSANNANKVPAGNE